MIFQIAILGIILPIVAVKTKIGNWEGVLRIALDPNVENRYGTYSKAFVSNTPAVPVKRPSALVLGLLLLSWIGGAAPINASPNVAPLARGDTVPVHDDTVYVADADPVVVVYEKQLDTLVVRAEEEAGAPIATAEASETGPAAEAELAMGKDDPTSESAPSSASSSTREGARNRPVSPSGGTPTGAASAGAKSAGATPTGVKKGISVAGLIIDRTHSVIGRDFQDAFNDHWTEPEGVSSFTIRIDEQPLPQFGSKIQVSVEGTTLFQAQLRPEYQRIRKAARQAAARTRYYLQEFYEPREVY
ncbi:curli production assembly/transport protein CsgE [Salinibacter ruber]|uniref:curli production assembly/transport protein CsgE n=1 Tax=Salinibacter ruber TaxID=146919 RepID=UPI001F0735FF|nr:curli production assembly/transport protein CsgE [Salinibacter ruber]